MTFFKLFAGVATAALLAGTPALAADLIIDVPVDEPITVAETGWYLSVFGGGVWDGDITADDDSDDDEFDVEIGTDTGWLLGLAVGGQVMDTLRGEIELSGASRDVSEFSEGDGSVDIDGTVTTGYLLGNLWFDLDTGSGFTPYVGGGIGAGYIHAESPGLVDPAVEELDADGFGLAYQVGAGVKFDVADSIALDLGYRWKAIAGAEISGDGTEDVSVDVGSHVVQAGVTFGF